MKKSRVGSHTQRKQDQGKLNSSNSERLSIYPEMSSIWTTGDLGQFDKSHHYSETCETGSFLIEGIVSLTSGRMDIWLLVAPISTSKLLLASGLCQYHKQQLYISKSMLVSCPSYLRFFPLTWTPSSSCVSLCSATYSPDNPAMLALVFSPYALELFLCPCFLCYPSPANLPSQADSLDLVQKVGHV